MNPDGTFTVCTAWEDHGQGADMGAVGTAHEALRPMGAPEAEVYRPTPPVPELRPHRRLPLRS